jgi:hypothetical protein
MLCPARHCRPAPESRLWRHGDSAAGGVAALAQRAPPLVPWAWGINGFASVAATLLATLLAFHCGYALALMLAALLYVFAGWQLPRAVRP